MHVILAFLHSATQRATADFVTIERNVATNHYIWGLAPRTSYGSYGWHVEGGENNREKLMFLWCGRVEKGTRCTDANHSNDELTDDVVGTLSECCQVTNG